MKGPERNNIYFIRRETVDPHAPKTGAKVNYYVPGTATRQTDVLGPDGQWHTTRDGVRKTWSSLGELFDSQHASEARERLLARQVRRGR